MPFEDGADLVCNMVDERVCLPLSAHLVAYVDTRQRKYHIRLCAHQNPVSNQVGLECRPGLGSYEGPYTRADTLSPRCLDPH